jgi:hypothetical protein
VVLALALSLELSAALLAEALELLLAELLLAALLPPHPASARHATTNTMHSIGRRILLFANIMNKTLSISNIYVYNWVLYYTTPSR